MLMYSCFIDFHKCFDSLWRKGVFYKLFKCGLSSKFISLVENIYCLSKSRVRLDNGYTEYFQTHCGTKQGCNLSPNLFNIFINDLNPHISSDNCDPIIIDELKVNFLAFADDIVLLSASCKGLQYCLKIFENYCSQWKLSINMKKTKIVIFNIKKHNHKFYFAGIKITEAKTYTYLGLILKRNGIMNDSMKSLHSKALKAFFSLRRSEVKVTPRSKVSI